MRWFLRAGFTVALFSLGGVVGCSGARPNGDGQASARRWYAEFLSAGDAEIVSEFERACGLTAIDGKGYVVRHRLFRPYLGADNHGPVLAVTPDGAVLDVSERPADLSRLLKSEKIKLRNSVEALHFIEFVLGVLLESLPRDGFAVVRSHQDIDVSDVSSVRFLREGGGDPEAYRQRLREEATNLSVVIKPPTVEPRNGAFWVELCGWTKGRRGLLERVTLEVGGNGDTRILRREELRHGVGSWNAY